MVAAVEIARLVLDYIDVLAWPLAVIAFALVFRKPISRLIDRIREAEVGGVRAAFGQAAAAIARNPELSSEDRLRLLSELRQHAPGWDLADELIDELLDVLVRVDGLEEGKVVGRGTMLPVDHPAHRPEATINQPATR